MIRSHVRPTRAAFLALAAGLPGLAHADIFSFAPSCNTLWYQECQTSPCGGGGWNTFNNWGFTACNWGLPTPGLADDVSLGAASITLNNNASVNAITNAPGGVLTWSAGTLSIALPFVNLGTISVPGSHKTLTGQIINDNALLLHGDWVLHLANGSIVNNAAMDVQGNKQLYENGGVNHFTNNGTVTKSAGGTADWRWPTTNNSQFDTQNGTNFFQFIPIHSTAASSWPTAANGTVRFNGCIMSGLFQGANNGLFQIEGNTASIPTNTTFAISGNGLNWSSGNMTIAPGQTLTNTGTFVVPGNHKMLSGALLNTGLVVAHGDWQWQLNDASVTNNGQFTVSGSKQCYEVGGTNQFTNNGTLTKDSGGTLDFRWPTQNNATIHTSNGTLFLVNTVVQSSPASTWTVDAAGTVRMTGLAIAGRFAGANNGLFQIEGSGLGVTAATTFAVTGNGVNWHSGNIAVAPGHLLTNTGILSLPGNHKQLSGAFRNTGSIVAHGDWQWQLNAGTVTNDGSFTVSGTKQCYETGGTNLFTNNGSLTKADGGTLDFRWPMQNNGVISTSNGTLFVVNTSVTSSVASAWPVASAGTVRLSGVTLAGRFAGNNAGTFQIEGGGIGVAANTALSITGNGLNWLAGNIAVAGGATLTNEGLMHLPGNHKALTGAMRNTGTILLHGDWQAQLSGGSLTNDGIMDFVGTKQCYEAGGTNAFVNNSILRQSAATTIDFRWPTTNHGMIDVQTGQFLLWCPFTQSASGTTRVSSTLNVGSGQTFAAGILEGSGSILGPVLSGAIVRPGGYSTAGTLSMNSTYTQNAAGSLDVEIGGPTPGSQHDRLAVSGNASLAGRIVVRFFNGFQPAPGSTFTVLTCNARSGVFDQIVVLDPLDGLQVAIDYTPTAVVVRVVACDPCTPCNGDVNCDFALDGFDVETQEKAVGGDTTDYCLADPDFNHDFSLDGFDVEAVEVVVGGGFCP